MSMEVERTKEYASKGVAGTALGIGIGAGVLSLLNGSLLGAAAPAVANAASGGGCSENTPVNRFELEQNKEIAQKDMEIAYWRGQDETNRKLSDVYSKLEAKINGVAAEVRANKDEQGAINMQQAVYNGTNTAALGCLQGQVAELLGMTQRKIPAANVCPVPMSKYNRWTAPTAETTT